MERFCMIMKTFVWGIPSSYQFVICTLYAVVMNESSLPFWWPYDFHSHAHLQGVSMVAVEHETVLS